MKHKHFYCILLILNLFCNQHLLAQKKTKIKNYVGIAFETTPSLSKIYYNDYKQINKPIYGYQVGANIFMIKNNHAYSLGFMNSKRGAQSPSYQEEKVKVFVRKLEYSTDFFARYGLQLNNKFYFNFGLLVSHFSLIQFSVAREGYLNYPGDSYYGLSRNQFDVIRLGLMHELSYIVMQNNRFQFDVGLNVSQYLNPIILNSDYESVKNEIGNYGFSIGPSLKLKYFVWKK